MSTLGDIVSLLEKIPIWKRLKTLPEQFDALYARVVVLEREIAKRPSLEQCPICNVGTLKVTSVHSHPKRMLGDAGVQEKTFKCDNSACGHTENRIHDPAGRLGKK